MSCILFLIEISTIGTHCLVAQDRVFFLKKKTLLRNINTNFTMMITWSVPSE